MEVEMYKNISLDEFKEKYHIRVVKIGDFFSVLREEKSSKDRGGKRGICLLRGVGEYEVSRFLLKLKREILRNGVSVDVEDEHAFRRVVIDVRSRL